MSLIYEYDIRLGRFASFIHKKNQVILISNIEDYWNQIKLCILSEMRKIHIMIHLCINLMK